MLSKPAKSGLFIVDPDKGTYSHLEGVALIIWSNLKTKKTKPALLKIITNEYEIDQRTAEKDLDEFLKQAIKLGFVETI